MKFTRSGLIESLRQLGGMLALLAIPTLVFWRTRVVDARIGSQYGCDNCYTGAVWQADGLFIAGAAALLWLSALLPWRVPRLALRLIVVLLLFLFFLDLVILQMFGIRILLTDLNLYLQHPGAVWEQTLAFLGGNLWAIGFFVILISLVVLICMAPRRPWRLFTVLAPLAAVAGIGLHFMPWQVNYVNSWILHNYLVANAYAPEAEPYSDEIIAGFSGRQTEQQCQPGLSRRPDVILVIVESLSAYMSKASGGHLNWTPRLDRLSDEALLIPAVHSNGFSTTEGLIGALGGVRLVAPFAHQFGNVVPFQTAWGIENSLPQLFNEAGYHTTFLTTGPLSFTNKGEWAEDVGFIEVEGNEASFYKKWPKVQFRSASDEALYARAMRWLNKQPPDQNNFLVLETVTSHQPYRDPISGERSLEKTIRFADKALATFIRRLRKKGWLEENLLIVTGDHRSMNPVAARELRRFGRGAYSRMPMLVFGDWPTGVRQGDYQLADLVPSLDYLINVEACLTLYQGNLFIDQAPQHCTLHRRGAQRSLVDVICPRGDGQVELNGDRTRFVVRNGIDDEQAEAVLALIARERLAGEQRHQDWLRRQQVSAQGESHQ